jgi:lipopolysaccharide export system permease protein
LTLSVTLYLKPLGTYQLKELLFNVATKSAAATITEKRFYDRFEGTTLYVDQVKPGDENPLKRVFISNEAGGKDPVIILAKEGGFAPSSGEGERSIGIQLEDGAIHQRSSQDDTYHKIAFSTYRFRLDFGAGGKGGSVNARRRGMKELYPREFIERLDKIKATGRPVYAYSVDWQKKFAQPFSVFVFALLALPLGMQRVRSARLTGFGLAIGVMLAYHLIDNALEALGDNGYIHHITAAWGANVVLGAIGVYIFYMAAKERPVIRVSAIEDLAKRILKGIKGIMGGRR